MFGVRVCGVCACVYVVFVCVCGVFGVCVVRLWCAGVCV